MPARIFSQITQGTGLSQYAYLLESLQKSFQEPTNQQIQCVKLQAGIKLTFQGKGSVTTKPHNLENVENSWIKDLKNSESMGITLVWEAGPAPGRVAISALV